MSPKRMPLSRFFHPVFLLVLAFGPSLVAAEPPDFNREVRPILSRYCFKCHGPDEGSRKGELRLDLREAALGKGESGMHAIVPGKVDESEVVTRIFSDDRDEIMPPPSAKLELNERDRAVIKKWIEAGAEYRPHWSFIPPKPPVVEVANGQNPIDAFIRTRLNTAGLKPSPEAERQTLIRRVSYDLIGLPPTPEELFAFVNDPRPDAYEHLVDRLLASPQYGERWARRWLDLARYADSNGYEKDRTRNIWAYRDWVVKALNADMPFDQFTIEQLAGDLLPQPTRDQLIATGFHRNTMLNEEGGIDPLEFRFHAIVDRVATTGTTWLGLTLGCAQCHTHKFDPITHRDYFGMMAFLNNADEPELDLPPADAREQLEKRAQQAAALLTALPSKWPLPADTATSTPPTEQDGVPTDPAKRRAQLVERAFADWLNKERAAHIDWKALTATEAKSNLPLLQPQPDGSIFVCGDTSKSDRYDLRFGGLPARISAIRLEVLPDDRLPAHGPGMTYYEGPKGDFFLGEITFTANGEALRVAKATHSHASNSMGGSNPVSASLAVDGDPQTGWSCAERPGERNEAVFVFEKPVEAKDLAVAMQFGRHYACSLGRFRISVTSDPRPAVAATWDDRIARLFAVPDDRLSATERAALYETFLLSTPEVGEAGREIKKLRKEPAWPTTLVMRERPSDNPRPTHRYHRGEFTQPKEVIEAAALPILNPLPADAPRNRLALARWLVSPDNPLTSRVVVNRAWAALFGKGLVKTTDDFGYQGETPSHPELLDWLALEFVKTGWSQKKLHRVIVTSATYRQSSRVIPEAKSADPDNRLLAYYPRIRLEAEMVRDGALRAAGILSLKIGGPPVKPPQADGISDVAYGNPKWDVSPGSDRYRRSLYTFAKRTAPFALYNTFDAPTGEACIARRDVSNTPLQALSLLNDITFLEVARTLGKQLASSSATNDDDRLQQAFSAVLGRSARASELVDLQDFLAAQRKRFATGELSPAAINGDPAAKDSERALWTTLARALLNLDETITKG